jgi:hypothetical protein
MIEKAFRELDLERFIVIPEDVPPEPKKKKRVRRVKRKPKDDLPEQTKTAKKKKRSKKKRVRRVLRKPAEESE